MIRNQGARTSCRDRAGNTSSKWVPAFSYVSAFITTVAAQRQQEIRTAVMKSEGHMIILSGLV
jgi:hypothetical protein